MLHTFASRKRVARLDLICWRCTQGREPCLPFSVVCQCADELDVFMDTRDDYSLAQILLSSPLSPLPYLAYPLIISPFLALQC